MEDIYSTVLRHIKLCKEEITYARTTTGFRYVEWREASAVCAGLRKLISTLTKEQRGMLKYLIRRDRICVS